MTKRAYCLWIAFASLMAGCSHYHSETQKARNDFYAGRFLEAAEALEKGARKDGKDQLLYLLDRATALFDGGNYGESKKDFHEADRLSDIKDYFNLSEEALTLVTNDRSLPYKGEDFERVLISQYLALTYLFLGDYEGALVECRRVNHKIQMMISQMKRHYKLNPFANYLAALIYESQGEYDHAYIDYQLVFKLAPQFPQLKEDLYRLAWKNKIHEDEEKWIKHFKLTGKDQRRIQQTFHQPELVLLVANGRSPEKRPHPAWPALPQYVPRENPIQRLRFFLDQQKIGESQVLYSIEQTAIETLNEKYAWILAKRAAGLVGREVMIHQVERQTNSPALGMLLRLGGFAADQADLRSWLTLPQTFQVLRVRLSENAKELRWEALDGLGKPVSLEVSGKANPPLKRLPAVRSQSKSPKVFIPIRVLS